MSILASHAGHCRTPWKWSPSVIRLSARIRYSRSPTSSCLTRSEVAVASPIRTRQLSRSRVAITALGTPRCRASHSSSWPLSGLSSAWSRRRLPTTRPPGSGTVIVRPPGRESGMESADPGRPLRLDDVPVAVEPLELQLERRDGHRVGARVQVGQGLVLRDPSAVQVVRETLRARRGGYVECDLQT